MGLLSSDFKIFKSGKYSYRYDYDSFHSSKRSANKRKDELTKKGYSVRVVLYSANPKTYKLYKRRK